MKKHKVSKLLFVGGVLVLILILAIIYRNCLSKTENASSPLNVSEANDQNSIIYSYSNQNRKYLLTGGDSPIKMLYWDQSVNNRSESIFENKLNNDIYFQTALAGFEDDNGWLFLQSAPSAGIVDSCLFLSDNQGEIWTQVSLSKDIPRHKVNDVIFIDKQTGFICCSLFDESPAPIFYTVDRGAHWENIQMPMQISENTSYQALYIRPIESNLLCAIQCRTSLYGESSYTIKYFLCEDISKINEWSEVTYQEDLLYEKIRDWEDNHLFKKIEETE